MFKKILIAIIALIGGLLAVRVVFYILGIVFKIVSSLFFLGFAILIAVPLYLYIKNRLLK
jgi:hypothetical protein